MPPTDIGNPTPDVPALLALASYLTTPDISPRFDWNRWCASDATPRSCGMLGCVGGHAVSLYPDRLVIHPASGEVCYRPDPNQYGHFAFAHAFGLTADESRAICHGPSNLASRVFELPSVTNDALGAAQRIRSVCDLAVHRHALLSATIPPEAPHDL